MENQEESGQVQVQLTLEDEFVLTQIRNKAKACATPKERDQFFWLTVCRLVARERAYKAVLNGCGITVSANVQIFEDPNSEDNKAVD
jgi:hypothetical protein